MSGKKQKVRLLFQILGFAFSLAFLALVLLGGKHAIHQACPYAVVCFGLSQGNFISFWNTAMGLAIVFGFAVLVYSMFYGRRFCGYLCPLGSVQEAIFSLRSRNYRIKHRKPYYTERKLSLLKYLILGVTCLLTILGLNYIFIRLCPFYSLSLLPRLAWPGLILLGLIILRSLYGEREWCRYLCPYAALLNAFQWLGEKIGIRRLKVRRNLERCTDCGICSLYCPMNINLSESEYVHNRNCIHCGLCSEKCPKAGTCNEECECEN